MSGKRPEHQAPPEIFYNEQEANAYTYNSRIAAVQAEMSFRALELLNLPEGQSCLLLDIGCGSGLSGEILEEEGHVWVGVDISSSMLNVAKQRQVSGDLFLQDIGEGFGFRPGVFDGAISISVIQWLCNADKSDHNPAARLARFFATLYSSLRRGARAVFQFYPENDAQMDFILSNAIKAGFTGGLVIDFPNSQKAKKYFLCLFAGTAIGQAHPPELPQGLEDMPLSAKSSHRSRMRGGGSKKGQQRHGVKDRDWVMRKKDLAKRRGKEVAQDSKYTGRKRKVAF